MERKKIFVSAYACEPDKGSEIGVGWHWVLEMSKQYDLWVLTRESNKLNIESWMSKNSQYNNITFVYYDLPKWMRWWKKGLRGVRTYYCLWQRCTNKLVKRVMTENDIEMYHLLTYGNALWPASSYGMKKFFIWGPVGGTDTIPAEFTKYYGMKARVIEWTRRVVVKLLPLNIGFRKRCKNADLILCKTEFMKENILPQYRHKAVVFTDVAVDYEKVDKEDCGEDKADVENREQQTNKNMKYLAVGRLDAWRGFDLLIEAFSKVVVKKSDIELEILGDGNYKNKLQELINNYGLSEKIILSGQVSEKEYIDRLKQADVVVNPALKEGNVTVAFDSLAAAKTLICVDTKGYTRSMGDNSIIIKRDSRQQMVDEISKAIVSTVDVNVRNSMINSAKDLASKCTWNEKGKDISRLIEDSYGR